MAAFGIAHILYIRAFGFQAKNWLVGVLCTLPGFLMYYVCYPGLKGKLVIAVLIYGFVITGMMWRAITCVQNQIEENGLCRWTRMSACIGAALFYISDNIIAINKFCFPVPGSRALIMTTYYAGQMFIAMSAFNIEEEYNLRMKSCKKCNSWTVNCGYRHTLKFWKQVPYHSCTPVKNIACHLCEAEEVQK